ncbi:hypothetical protein [Dactylosporangium sp. NPDC049140]|uniref:hypothetical protein n=1 Tax=Dactylosporangium sp. NPDC049140 TaxID=3155647 RepID=UPI0033D9C74A
MSVHDAAGAEVARWTLHHEVNLRGLDGGERELRDGPGLVDWLAERGLPGRLRVREHMARYSAALERRRLGWVACAPPALTRAADAATHSPDRHQERLAIAILRWYPDPAERIRMLLEWARYRAEPDEGADESVIVAYSGTYFYESTLHRLLLEEPWDALVAAPRTPAQRDGLAKLADSHEWMRAGYPKLPGAAG